MYQGATIRNTLTRSTLHTRDTFEGYCTLPRHEKKTKRQTNIVGKLKT